MNWTLRDATITVKVTVAVIALVVSTGLPALFYFYKVNAWADQVAESEAVIVTDSKRSVNLIQLDLIKLKIYRLNDKKRDGGLTIDEEEELVVFKIERRLVLEAIAAGQE